MSDRLFRFLASLLGVCAVLVCGIAIWENASLNVFSEPQVPATLILDAGHGGEDGGCIGVNGALESCINLSIALRIRDLSVFCGVPVKMIRQTDCSVYREGCRTISEKKVSDIQERTRMVNETPNAVLVSIHQNYFPQQKYHGAQVFYAKTPYSETFAVHMQTALRAGLDAQNNRLAKPSDSVYLLEHVSAPAILIECGFLSNPEEADLLLQPSYQKKLSSVICAEIIRFITSEEYKSEV